MVEECRLCGRQANLQNSHIIPRFVVRWIKNTSATPFLRGAENPDSRIQDYHENLLCETCEQKFSDYERKFATEIFYPHINGEKSRFEYGEWLQKFIISISWRLIVSETLDIDELNDYHSGAIKDAEKIWRDILNDDLGLSADPFTHHIYFLDDIVLEENSETLPDKWEFYVDRGIDGTPVIDGKTAMYFKFPKVLFFSCIQPPQTTGLRRTQVQKDGKIGPPQEMGPEWGTFVLDRVREVTEHSISDSEQEKITEHMLKNMESAAESESMKTYEKQLKRRIINHNPLDYLNEHCPVCHTEHKLVEFLPKRPLKESEIERMNTKNEFVRGVYMRGELSIDGQPKDGALTFVLSTINSTRIITLFTDVGWIVERKVEHPEDVNPEEIGQEAWENTLQEYKEWVRKQSERSYLILKENIITNPFQISTKTLDCP